MELAPVSQKEAAHLQARAAKSKQDAKTPFLIHVDDGRLMPNIAILRNHPKYRPYGGDLKASKDERLQYLKSVATGRAPRPLVNTEPEPFDVGKASKDELVAFALMEYGDVLPAEWSLSKMRNRIIELANAGESLG